MVEHPAARLLQQSSDAVVVIRLEDGLIVDANEALYPMAGHRGEDLIGRSSHELLIWSTVAGQPGPAGGLGQLRSVGEVPVGFRTRSGELRVGELSILVVGVEDDRHAVCTLRAGRDPAAAERRSIARLELWRILRGGGNWLKLAEAALRVAAACLCWELGAVWSVDREAGVLRCAHVWCAPVGCPEDLRSAGAKVTFRAGEGLLGRVWEVGETIWMPDVQADPGLVGHWTEAAPAPVHGRLAVPVSGGGEVLGVLELVSRGVRVHDQGTLDLLHWFASHLGTVAMGGVPDDPDAELVAGLELERGPLMLRELARSVGRLNRLLEGLEADLPERAPTERAPAVEEATAGVGELRGGLPAGLTLKAVSERTGIPAATLRTWERRYRFLHPTRSASGYRLYGEDDITRILEVKRLLEHGVRISEAMAAVRERPPEGGDG
jgi:MerR HTH family regulatory protein/GAF domain/PAS fold